MGKVESVEIHIIKLKYMNNEQITEGDIIKGKNCIAHHVEISFWQISQKLLTFKHENVLLAPHNVDIPNVLRGHTTL